MSAIKVTDEFPPQHIGRRPFCEAALSRYCVERNREWAAWPKVPGKIKIRQKRGIPLEQCGCYARYKINGKYYCRKHGALVALDLVAEQVKP